MAQPMRRKRSKATFSTAPRLQMIEDMTRRLLQILLSTSLLFASSAWAMDPDHGKQVLRDQNCLTCHNVRGEGGVTAPDLAARLIDHYTPAELSSLLWNHLPEMWAAMTNDKVAKPKPTERDAEDLFGVLYASHFATPVGTQDRGERAFEQRGCAACHTKGPGMPVENWKNIRDSFSLVQQMWNHASLMQDAREKRGVMFEKLSSRDLGDLTSYVTKGAAKANAPATLPETKQGEVLYKANCGACHPGIVNLQKRMRDRTPTEVAAAIWNHANSMQKVPLAAPNDMRAIVGYVWNLQFQETGDAAKGAKAFTEKRCIGCHMNLARGERIFTPYSMMTLWWAHGPLMLADQQKTKTRWPRLDADDVLNLVAYMNKKP